MSKITIKNGILRWYNEEGHLHREDDKPAVIHLDGTKIWYKNNCTHRDNFKPAVVFPGGNKEWWENGKFIWRNYE